MTPREASETNTKKVNDDWSEDGVLRLQDTLPLHARTICCITCVLSD